MERYSIWIITTLLSIFFVLVGSLKILGAEMFLEQFIHFGLNRMFMTLVGVGEVIGAVLIWFRDKNWLGPLGAAILAAISGSALGFHLLFDIERAIPALVTLVFSSVLLFLIRGPLIRRTE